MTGVIRQLNLAVHIFDVVLAGRFFDGSPLLIKTMHEVIRSVAPGARLVRLHAPPVVGGVLLGMEMGALKASAVRQTLIKSTDVLLVQARGTRWAAPESGA